MLFFVKVRLDVNKLGEFAQRLQAGAFSAHPISTYCLQADPSVGLNIWEAADREAFERAFAPQREYYAEVLEVIPVITPQEAQQILVTWMNTSR